MTNFNAVATLPMHPPYSSLPNGHNCRRLVPAYLRRYRRSPCERAKNFEAKNPRHNQEFPDGNLLA